MAPPKEPAAVPAPSQWQNIQSITHAVVLLVLAAICSPLSQLVLAPVYGSIPSAQFHHLGVAIVGLLSLTRRSLLSQWIPARSRDYIQVWACMIPFVQTLLLNYSTLLGPTAGPVLTELVTYFPLLFLSAYTASENLAAAKLERYLPAYFGDTLVGFAAYGLFTSVEGKAMALIGWVFSLSEYLTRNSLQVLLGACYWAASGKKMYIMTAIPLLQTILFSPHSPSSVATDMLNMTLHNDQWNLVARGESVTGYISVLENLELGYRALRCDHSLLGGEWLVTDERRKEGITVPEPIYSVFEMLEAVRLVEGPMGEKPDAEKNALVIGLGIGTAPAALISHGISTTILELDPLVHAYALTHFSLPANHTAILQDAVPWVHSAAAAATAAVSSLEHPGPESDNKTYDYILHDVFTGGAEPLALFTSEFLSDLRALLRPSGVIALNYAGDLGVPATRDILGTIVQAFGGACRVFRDAPPPPAGRGGGGGEGEGVDEKERAVDFLNMVVFCTPPPLAALPQGPSDSDSDSDGDGDSTIRLPTFRMPTESDFLGSQSRKHYLYPRPELELALPSGTGRDGRQTKVLTRANMREFERGQVESAKRHWGIMRGVLPGFVWEGY